MQRVRVTWRPAVRQPYLPIRAPRRRVLQRFAPRQLPGYGLLNLRTSWQVAPQWKVLARIENVNDRDYELARGYNTPGRSGFVELIWSAH